MPPTRSNDWLLKASSPRSSIGTPHDPGALRTMSLTPLLDVLVTDPMVRRILTAPMGTDHAAQESPDIAVSAGARPPLIAVLARAQDSSVRRPILAVTATGREAEDLVAPVRALLQPLVKGLGELVPVALKAGDETPMGDVVEALAAAAYVRTDLVERRGEFAVRGGILDVFPPTEEHPVRVEFWGDTVEEIRWFKVADQRSLEVAGHGLWAPPCREVLLTTAVRERAAILAEQLPGVADMLGKVAEGIAVEGMESLAPALVDGMESLLDVLPQGTHVVLTDPERVRKRAYDLVATSDEFLDASWSNAAAGNAVPIDLHAIL